MSMMVQDVQVVETHALRIVYAGIFKLSSIQVPCMLQLFWHFDWLCSELIVLFDPIGFNA